MVKRTLPLALLATWLFSAGCATLGLGEGKDSPSKRLEEGKKLQDNYEFLSQDGAYGCVFEIAVKSDRRTEGLLPLLGYGAEDLPSERGQTLRASSRVQTPTSLDGQTLLVSSEGNLTCTDLESGTIRWRLPVGEGRVTILPYQGYYVVKPEERWDLSVTIDPAKGEIVPTANPPLPSLPSPAALDSAYVRFSIGANGLHRYEFLPDGPELHGLSRANPPRFNYTSMGAFDSKTQETLWILNFRRGIEAFNRAGDRYFFQTTDQDGVGRVYVLRIVPRRSPAARPAPRPDRLTTRQGAATP